MSTEMSCQVPYRCSVKRPAWLYYSALPDITLRLPTSNPKLIQDPHNKELPFLLLIFLILCNKVLRVPDG